MKFPHNISRVEAFSDGVFAFAATLMVVGFDWDAEFRLLQAQGTTFIAFAVSFFVLAAFWWVHYNFFRRAGYVDNWILFINTILLFVILYYVFPLKTLVDSIIGKNQLTMEGLSNLFASYSIGFALIFLCYSLLYLRAYKRLRSISQALVCLFYARHFAIYVLVALMSIVLSSLQIGVGIGTPGFVYALLGPLCYWHSAWFKRKYDQFDLF